MESTESSESDGYEYFQQNVLKRKKKSNNKNNKKIKTKSYITYNNDINENCESSLSDVFFILKNNTKSLKDFEIAELTLMIITNPEILYEDLFNWEKTYQDICKNDWNFITKHLLKKFYYQCKTLSTLLYINRNKKNISNNNVFMSNISKNEFEKIKLFYKNYKPIYKKQSNKLCI